MNRSEMCRSCGKKLSKIIHKFVATSLLGLGTLCWGCHLAASATGAEINMPEPEPMGKATNFIFTITNGTLVTATASATPSGDLTGMTFSRGDFQKLSEIPAYEKEIQGIEAPVMADSILQGIVNKHGGQNVKPGIKSDERYYQVGSGDAVKFFKVV